MAACRIVLQYCFYERILTVLNRKNGVKVYILCYEGTDFSCAVIALEKTLRQPLLMFTRSMYMLIGTSYCCANEDF